MVAISGKPGQIETLKFLLHCHEHLKRDGSKEFVFHVSFYLSERKKITGCRNYCQVIFLVENDFKILITEK